MTRPELSSPLSFSARSGRRAVLLAASAATALAWGLQAQALPAGGSVQAGSATITTGAKEVDVNQSSQRAFIDWGSFNLSSDEKVAFQQALGAKSITFNRVSDPNITTTIAGTITASGGVWLFTPGGLIIGPTAQINVGSFVASTGDVDTKFCQVECSGPSGPFQGGPDLLTDHAISIFGAQAPIEVQTGAQITADNGFVMLNSEQITQNGAITAPDGVAFVLADNSTINFTDDNATGAAQQLGVIDISGANPAPNAFLSHGGSTTGAWVQVTAPDESANEGTFAAVINLSGVVEATGLAPLGTDQNSVVLVGLDGTVATPIGATNRSFSIDASGGAITGDAGGLYFTGGSVKLGGVDVAGAVEGVADADLTLSGTVSAGDRGYLAGDTVSVNANASFGGDLQVSANGLFSLASNKTVSAAGGVDIETAGGVTLGAGSTVRSDSGGAELGDVTINADSLDADATSSIVAGSAKGDLTSNVTITTSGDLDVGAVSGVDVSLTSNGGGDVLIAGQGTAVDGYGAISYYGDLTVGPGVTIRADIDGDGVGELSLQAPNVSADATSSLIGGADASHTTGDVSLDGYNSLTFGQVAGHNVSLFSSGDLTLAGNVTASGNLTVDPTNLDITGDLVVGGALNLWADDTLTIASGVKVSAGGGADIESGAQIILGAGSILQSDAAGLGGAIYLESGTIAGDTTSLLVAGPLSGPGSDIVTVYADGGDLTVGKVIGTDVKLEARAVPQCDGECGDAPPPPDGPLGGSVFVAGAVKAAGDFTALSDFADVHLDASVTAAGAVTVTAAGAILSSPSVVITGDTDGDGNAMKLTAAGDVLLDATSALINGASATAPTGDVTVTAGGNITTGQVAGDTVELTAPDTVTVGGPVFGSGSVTIDPTDVVLNGSVSSAGVVDISADDSITLADGVSISAGAGLTLNATTISAGTGVTLQSDSNGDGKGDLDVEADAITGGANLIAGPDATHPTASITATAFDGDLELGGVTGVIVTLNAFNGDVTLEGPSTIGQALTVGASGGAISILGDVTSGGTIDLTASDTLSFGGGVTVKAADHLIGAASSISIGANAVVASDSDHDGAGELTLHAPGDIIADATSSVDGGHATVTLTSDNGQLALGAVSGGDIILSSALDLTVGGNIQARGALSATSTTGGVLVKSSVSSGGDMDLTATTTLAISANANVLAGGHLHGTGVTITVGAKDVLRSDTGGQGGARDLDLHASGALTADATSLIAGGANLTAPVTLETDGGALSAGAISGSTISVSSSAATTLGGALNAATDISAGGTSIAVNGNATSGGGIDLETAGVITIAANLTLKAAADLTVGGSVVTIGAGDTLQADSAGTGGSELFVNATGAVNADATSTLLAGPSLANPTGFVLVEAGGDIHLGQVAADEVEVFTQGDITLAGPVHGVSAVFIDPANITVLGDITSDGLIALQTESGGAISIGANVKVTSTGDEVLLVSDGDLTIGGGASVTGVSLLASTGGVLHLASGASLNTTGQATAPTWPIVPDTIQPGGEGPVNVTGLNIEAAGLDLQGSLVAGKAGARDDIYIQIVDAPQTVTVGGADSAGGVHISNAAIGRMTARNLIIMAGAGDGAGANADILVQDLALNSANLSALALGTASDNTITVAGQVTLQGPGPVDLHLGFAGSGTPFGLPSGPNVGGAAPPLQGFIPGEIDITGSLGQSGAAFNSTVLLARNDIFMGSAAFIAAAKADPAFDAGKQSSAYTVDQDHVFVASHGLELAAQGRIIQQNTGGSLRYAGLLIGTPVTGHPLVSDPATLDGQTVGDVEQDAGWIPNYALGPTRVDLFGVVTRPDASTTHGVDAALEPNLSAPVIADVSHYKINTCVFATHCVGTTPPRIELPDADQAQDQADQAAAAASQSPTTFAESIQIDDTSDDRKDANGAPVTESGNGDLWTGPPSSPK